MRRYALICLAVLLPLIAIFSIAQDPGSKPLARDEAISDLRAKAPGVRFYEKNGRISRVYGVPFGSGETAADSAASFVTRYAAIFDPGDAILAQTGAQDVMNGKFTAVYFTQTVGGYKLDRSNLTILVRNEPGYPVVLASSGLQEAAAGFSAPSITGSQAQDAVRRRDRDYAFMTTPGLIAYKGEVETYLAWTFIADNGRLDRQKRVQAFVDAETGRILELRNKVYTVDVTGNAQAKASPGLKPDNTVNPPATTVLAGLRVAIGAAFAYTNNLGDFVISNAGTAPVTVTTDMRGRWVRVVPSQGSALAGSQTVTPPGPANFSLNSSPTEFNTSQVNALKHVEMVHNFAKAYSPSYPGIDIQLPANVNIANTCNANYNGSSINFFASQSPTGCPNTAYSTVIYHEYGHFVIDMGHPTAAGDYHEGMADTNANLLTNVPGTGEDFFGPNSGWLRSAYNSVTYPCSAEAHECGQIISGAFWLTRDALVATVGETTALQLVRTWYFGSILLRPEALDPGVTIDVLTLDDNDGNLNNGTPHYAEIEQGFGAKNLHAPPINWVTFTINSWPGEFYSRTNARLVKPDWSVSVANNAGTLNPTTFKFHYKINTGAWQVLSVPGSGNYRWNLPVLNGSVVQWYLSAQDTQGRTTLYPRGGQAEAITTVTGGFLQTVFTDTMETDNGWTVQNVALSTGAWVRQNPNGTSLDGRQANPENDSADAGTFCYFTGQAAPGGGPGDQDVDGGPTYLISPTFNMTGANHIVTFEAWYYNSTGDDPFKIEVSNDNGASWVTVKTIMDTGTQNTWTTMKFSVASYVTPTAQVKVRFSAIDNPNNSVVEGAIDNVRIQKVSF